MKVQALFCSAVAVTMIGQASIAADLQVPSRFANIQATIDAANPGDVVMVADGVYTGAGNRDLSFHGKAITVRSANGPDACTIDCQGTPEVPYRGFCFSSGEGPDSILMGFTITNGATARERRRAGNCARNFTMSAKEAPRRSPT